MTDFGDGALDRFSYTYTGGTYTFNPAGNVAGNAQYITGKGMTSGFVGTRNDLIIATGGSSETGPTNLARYALNGSLIGNITVANNGFTGGGNGSAQTGTANHTFAGINGMAISDDARYLFVTESTSATNGIISKIDLATSQIVSQVSFAGAHDVTVLSDGSIYAAALNSTSASSRGMWHFSSALVKDATAAIPYSTSTNPPPTYTGIDHVTFMKVVGNNLYVADSDTNAAGAIAVYSLTGSGSIATPAIVNVYTPATPSLDNFYGAAVGQDGNLYIADIGTGKANGNNTFTGSTTYVNGVYSFNTSSPSNTVSTAIAGWNNSTGTTSNGLDSPIYISFDANFSGTNDQGTPEPGSIALACCLLTVGVIVRRRKRNRTNCITRN